MNLLKGRRIEGTGLGGRIPVRIMRLIFGDADGRRHINPSFQHSSIQEFLLDCVSTLHATAEAGLRLCLAGDLLLLGHWSDQKWPDINGRDSWCQGELKIVP
ncbi:MAG: hypothetical protein WC540_14180 [Sulfuritalea sp.]